MTGTLTLDNGGLAGQSVTNTWTGPIALASSNAIAAAGGGRFVINGVISTSAGTPSLFISGFGTTEFQVNNTYTGTTTVEANNTLQIDAPSGLGAGGAGNGTTIDNGGELDLNFTGSLQDAGANAEALTLNGNGSPFGTDLGALEVLAAHGVTIPGTVTLGSDATIGVGTGTLTFPATAVISGNFNLTYDEDAGGQGEIITQAANTYGGATTTTDIKSGVILNIQNNAGLGNASPTHTAIVEDGAALQTQGALGTIANNLQFNTTAAADFPTAATGSLEDVSGSTTFSGTVTLNNATTVQTQISVDTAGTANRLVLSGAIQGRAPSPAAAAASSRPARASCAKTAARLGQFLRRPDLGQRRPSGTEQERQRDRRPRRPGHRRQLPQPDHCGQRHRAGQQQQQDRHVRPGHDQRRRRTAPQRQPDRGAADPDGRRHRGDRDADAQRRRDGYQLPRCRCRLHHGRNRCRHPEPEPPVRRRHRAPSR